MRDRRKPPQPPEETQLVPRRPAALQAEDYGYGYGGYDYYDEPGGEGLMEYWRILMRRKGLIILSSFLGGLAFFLYTMPQTPVYKAMASIEILQYNPQFMGMSQVNPIQEGGSNWNNQDIETKIAVMQAPELRDRVTERLRQTRPLDYSARKSRAAAWREALNLPTAEEVDEWEATLDETYATIRPRQSTRIVEISVDSTDPRMAADFANAFAAEYIDYNRESRWTMAQQTGDWLTQQLDEMRIKLERSEEQLHAYARKAGLTITETQGSVADDKLRQLQQSLTEAEADRIAKLSRFELISKSPADALPDVLNDASLRAYDSTLTNLRSEDAQLSTTFTDEHSSRQRIRAQIEIVEAALARERAAIIQRIRNEYEEANRRVALLRDDYDRQAAVVSDQAGRSVQYNILRRDVDTYRELYEMMLEQVKSSSVASALDASNVRMVERAQPPEIPYKPNLARQALLGLFLGGFLGVAFVIARERMDTAIKDPGDSNFYLRLPELGVIPAGGDKRSLKVIYRSKNKLPGLGPLDNGEKEEANGERTPVELTVWKRQPSVMAESFRAALTSILFSGQNGDRPHILTLTSASPSEGKTTVASNLAIALAEINRQVLLIDADMRKPRQHEVFGVSRERGLSDLLLDRTPLGAEILQGAIRETKVENLFLLPAGTITSGSTNLLYSERMEDLLRRLDDAFDTILIDTPPMMQIPDARILGRMSDAVILVLRAGKTMRDTALAARQRFAEDGTQVMGTILNYYDPKKSGGGRHYGYGYRYYGGEY